MRMTEGRNCTGGADFPFLATLIPEVARSESVRGKFGRTATEIGRRDYGESGGKA